MFWLESEANWYMLKERFSKLQEQSKENAKVIEEYAQNRDRIIQRVFGSSDSILAKSWFIHELFIIGYADGFVKAFEESFATICDQESIEGFEPEAFKQRELERRLQALRYLLPYCTSLRFPKLVSQALEQSQRLESSEQLRTMLYKLLLAKTDQEAKSALAVQDTSRGTNSFREIIQEGSEEGEKEGLGEALLQFVELRFPILLTQAKEVIEQETSIEQIRTRFNKLRQANTAEEAQAALLMNGE